MASRVGILMAIVISLSLFGCGGSSSISATGGTSSTTRSAAITPTSECLGAAQAAISAPKTNFNLENSCISANDLFDSLSKAWTTPMKPTDPPLSFDELTALTESYMKEFRRVCAISSAHRVCGDLSISSGR